METYGCQTVADLVRLVDLDQSSVSRYLSGQSEPTMENLRKIARGADRTVGDLMVAGGMATPQELGMVRPPTRRLAPVLRSVQDVLDDPVSTDMEEQFLLKSIRGLLNMVLEARQPVIAEPAMRRRR